MADEVAALERMRLVELEKQRAIHGSSTDPAILIEIEDLRRRIGPLKPAFQPARRRTDNDFEFWSTMVASSLQRITVLEQLTRNWLLGLSIGIGLLSVWIVIVMAKVFF